MFFCETSSGYHYRLGPDAQSSDDIEPLPENTVFNAEVNLKIIQLNVQSMPNKMNMISLLFSERSPDS